MFSFTKAWAADFDVLPSLLPPHKSFTWLSLDSDTSLYSPLRKLDCANLNANIVSADSKMVLKHEAGIVLIEFTRATVDLTHLTLRYNFWDSPPLKVTYSNWFYTPVAPKKCPPQPLLPGDAAICEDLYERFMQASTAEGVEVDLASFEAALEGTYGGREYRVVVVELVSGSVAQKNAADKKEEARRSSLNFVPPITSLPSSSSSSSSSSFSSSSSSSSSFSSSPPTSDPASPQPASPAPSTFSTNIYYRMKLKPVGLGSIFSAELPLQRGYGDYVVEGESEETLLGPTQQIIFVVHGIGECFAVKKENGFLQSLIEQMDETRVAIHRRQVKDWTKRREAAEKLAVSHSQVAVLPGPPPRIEVLPISWWSVWHTGTSTKKALQKCTIDTIPVVRTIANDIVFDVLQVSV